MKYFGELISVFVVLSGCSASVPSVAPRNGAAIYGNVLIDTTRRVAYFSLENRNNHDLVCGPIHKRVVFDAPQSYLDVGEGVSSDGMIYFSAGQRINSEVRARDFPNRAGGNVEIQFATFGSEPIECRWADVQDYCDARFIDQIIASSTTQLPEVPIKDFNASSCRETAEKVETLWFWQRSDPLPQSQLQFLSRFARYGLLSKS